MKTNRQSQITGNHQKWYIGGLTVLLLGAGGTWALIQKSEPATYRHQQTASARHIEATIETPKVIKHHRSPRIAIERPSHSRRDRKHESNNKTDRRRPRRNPGEKIEKNKITPAA